eukprot:4905173-Karenia_brevis.AAC.1
MPRKFSGKEVRKAGLESSLDDHFCVSGSPIPVRKVGLDSSLDDHFCVSAYSGKEGWIGQLPG